jgi:hypothetical protein
VNRKLSMTADASPGSEHRGASTSSIIDNLVLTLGVVSIKAMICSLVNSLFTKESSGENIYVTNERIVLFYLQVSIFQGNLDGSILSIHCSTER